MLGSTIRLHYMRRRQSRKGIRIRGHRGDPRVRAALIRYARWLRRQFEFPVFVPVYLLPGEFVRTMHGEDCSASIFLPWSRTQEPYIRVATGDYVKLASKWGRDSAIAAFLVSLSHEVLHYRQWVETGDFTERGVALSARHLVRRYAREVASP
jgi:hypothetical protein